jgi:hypothetical protein
MASRKQLLAETSNLPSIVDIVVQKIYEREEKKVWEEGLWDEPHGQPWHVSFHASEFPGNDPKACARKAIYGLMDIPAPKPVEPSGRAIMEQGKAAEEAIVWRLHRAGILATRPPDAEHQMGFRDTGAWLTGSPDAVIALPGPRYHIVEIKSKSDAVIKLMQDGERSYDPKHYKQLQTYLGLAKLGEYESENHIHQVNEGSLYYVSRENPLNTKEFRFLADDEFYDVGRTRLLEWKQFFLDGELPPRPEEWKWSEEPCKYCPMKAVACKPDYKAKVQKLEDSASIEFAQSVRPKYNYEQKRRKVLDFWSL